MRGRTMSRCHRYCDICLEEDKRVTCGIPQDIHHDFHQCRECAWATSPTDLPQPEPEVETCEDTVAKNGTVRATDTLRDAWDRERRDFWRHSTAIDRSSNAGEDTRSTEPVTGATQQQKRADEETTGGPTSTARMPEPELSTEASVSQSAWCRGSTFDDTAHAEATIALTTVARSPPRHEERKGRRGWTA